MSSTTALDPFGLPFQVQEPASAGAVNDFIEGFLHYEPRILAVLAAAEHDCSLMVQACAAALQLFAEAPSGPPAARLHLERAREAGNAGRAGHAVSERERSFAAAIQAWADGDVDTAIAHHAAILEQFPQDLCSLKLAQYHAFNRGDSPTMLRLALQARPTSNGQAAHAGMLAFAFEQCHRLGQAETAARDALAVKPHEPWAQHALAHVLLTQGRLREGEQFMRASSGGWSGLTSFMRTHNWWHLALFLIELGDEREALRLYDHEVWGVDKTYSQDQIGAVSLLARLELAGVDVGERWRELAQFLAVRVHDQVQPFLDMQYLYGLARAGRDEALPLLRAVESFAANLLRGGGAHTQAELHRAWAEVCLPACRGLLAHAQGQWAEAASQLELALPRLARIGGSHAQRELFGQIHLDALQRAGELVGAQNLLQPLVNAQPESLRLRRRLSQVYTGLALPTLS